MPKKKTRLEYNTFVKGLITEASPLTYPDNASIYDVNMVLNRDGSRQRRLGMDYEENSTPLNISSLEGTDTTVNSYTWKSVSNRSDLDIAVLQVGNNLYFYDNNVSPVTGSPLNGGSSVTIGTVTTRSFQFAESYGKLIIASGSENVYVIEYNSALDTMSLSSFRLKVRDLFGIESSVPDGERPTSLTTAHSYNLRNQGWPLLAKCANNDEGNHRPITADPVALTFSLTGVYPSSADTIAAGKFATPNSVTQVNAYSPHELVKSNPGTTSAPKGQTILDLFTRGYSRGGLWGILFGIPTDSTSGGISSVASYAGRLFYSIRVDSVYDTDGNSPNLGSMIFYSKNTDNVAELGDCHSFNDPTSEELNDVLDTDGGFITIPDVGFIYKLVTLGESLFVISSKGVWEISGGDQYFSATTQSINKVSNFGAVSSDSIVAGESLISFWSPGGIYGITLNDIGRGVAQNITQNTIQSAYDDINSVSKKNAIGAYDDVSKQFRWLYTEGLLSNSNYYNRELVFDLNLQAFYINELQSLTMTSGGSPYVIGYLDISSTIFTDQVEDVVVGVNQVQAVGEDIVTTLRESNQTTKGSTKYWCIRDLGTGSAAIRVSGYRDLLYRDWASETDFAGNSGKDALAVLITGYATDGDSTAIKKSKDITVFLKRTETGFTDDGSGNLTAIHPSSCKMQAQWEWTDSPSAGRWSSESEVYRLPRFYLPIGAADPFDFGFTVVKTKNRVRGKGSTLSLKFSSTPLKDLHLYGWSREVETSED